MRIKPRLLVFSLILLAQSSFAGTVILKADDFGRGGGWYRFLLYSVNNNIPVNVGIIADDLTNERKSKTADLIKRMAPYGQQFSFFYHGHNHNCDETSSIFLTGSEAYQWQILNSDLRTLQKAGITPSAFGGPCNHGNEHTAAALESNGFTQWLLSYVATEGFTGEVLTHRVDLESAPGKTDICNFLKELDALADDADDTIVVQFHPGLWKTEDMESFERATAALERKGWSYRLLK
ncbi:MAG: DUF2334 domain-containing protein [Thalassolituus sp.]